MSVAWIMAAIGWGLAGFFAAKFYKYAKPFAEQAAKLEAANKRSLETLRGLQNLDIEYQSRMKLKERK